MGVRRQRDVADVETDEEKKYQIVGDLEADIKLGLIAISSPVARAMIGKLEGEFDRDRRPAGQREYDESSASATWTDRWQRGPCCAARSRFAAAALPAMWHVRSAVPRPCSRAGRTRAAGRAISRLPRRTGGGRVDASATSAMPPAPAGCVPIRPAWCGHAWRADDGLRRNAAADPMADSLALLPVLQPLFADAGFVLDAPDPSALVPAASNRPGAAGLQ